MPIAFPSIRPSSRSYSPGTYPQTEFRAQNGALTVVRFSNRRVQAELSLGFDNITDAEAAQILANYEAVNSIWNYVQFTAANATVGIGSSESLSGYIREASSGLRWRYAEPPSVESVMPNRNNVSCKFVAELDAA